MEKYLVKDLMVPISEYATVVVGTPLLKAVEVLEKAQEAYTESKYQHRAILVLDENGRIIGKISQLRALKAIEPDFQATTNVDELKTFNFSDDYLAKLRDLYRSTGQIMSKEILREAATKKVEDFMQMPTPGEFVSENSSLDTAIHRLVAGTHLSLLVIRDDIIVGVLRISDVFAAVFREMTTLDS